MLLFIASLQGPACCECVAANAMLLGFNCFALVISLFSIVLWRIFVCMASSV